MLYLCSTKKQQLNIKVMTIYRTSCNEMASRFTEMSSNGIEPYSIFTVEFSSRNEISLSSLDEYIILTDTPSKLLRLMSDWFVNPLKSI